MATINIAALMRDTMQKRYPRLMMLSDIKYAAEVIPASEIDNINKYITVDVPPLFTEKVSLRQAETYLAQICRAPIITDVVWPRDVTARWPCITARSLMGDKQKFTVDVPVVDVDSLPRDVVDKLELMIQYFSAEVTALKIA